MKPLLIFTIALFASTSAIAHPADENPDLSLPESVQEFRHMRFGLFIHWDPARPDCYSPVTTDTAALLRDFHPHKFDSTSWVSLAKSSGAHYLVFNANSSDGMALWASDVAPRTVVKSTPYGLDIVKPLAYECQRQGIKFYVSYNVADSADSATTQPITAQAAREITELLNWCGKLGGLRLTGIPDGPNADAARENLFGLIHKLQPAALVGGDYPHNEPLPDENFRIESAARNADSNVLTSSTVEYLRLPVEVNQTVNDSKTFCSSDQDFRTSKDLLHALVRAAGMDKNLLLHVAAMPNGEVQPESAERVLAVGQWLAKYGASIYSTRGGPADAAPWGVTTHRFNRVYVHVIDSQTTSVTIKLPSPAVAARYITDEATADYAQSGDEVTVTLRPERGNEMERLVVLWTK